MSWLNFREIGQNFKEIFANRERNERSKEGDDAYYAGMSPDHCPYPEGSQEASDWIDGYFKGFLNAPDSRAVIERARAAMSCGNDHI